jgi:hypothetical protein
VIGFALLGIYGVAIPSVRQFIQGPDTTIHCTGMEASELVQKLNAISETQASRKKKFRWRARSLVDEKAKRVQGSCRASK